MTEENSSSWELIQILDNTIEGILIIEDGFIKSVNKSLLNILNYDDKDELIGNLATGILIPTSTKKYIEYNTKMFQEISLITKNATIIPAIVKIKDIKIDSHEYKMVSVLDMSDLKEKESMLLEQSRLAAMGEMISVIAHQWRQPLNAIASIATRLKMNIKMNKLNIELVDEKTDEINNYLQYMSKTIDDFRNFFEPTKNKTFISLNEIVSDSLKIVGNSFENKNIELDIENKQLENMYLYKNELIQVILNILNNARDAYEDKNIDDAKVSITYKEDELSQTIYIQDNAGGIPDDVIKKIFEPYFSTKNRKNGTGLGLYICKSIVEKYSNGELLVQNKNGGALFEIKISK